MADEVTTEEATALVDEVLSNLRITDPEILKTLNVTETEYGRAVRFNANSQIVPMQCLYLLEPAAENLLRKYPSTTYPGAASTLLMWWIAGLPVGVHIGMENTYDGARMAVQQQYEAIVSVEPKTGKQFDSGKIKEWQKAIRKQMCDRNYLLIDRPKTGKSEVPVSRISAAVGRLRAEGTPLMQITAEKLAIKLSCEANSIHKAFKRQGSSLKEFLRRVTADN